MPRGSRVNDLASDASVGSGLQLMLAGALKALRNRNGQGDSTDPEAIHRFRVGVRRFRSMLSILKGALPDRERRALGGRLGQLAQCYGRAREWDVFQAKTVVPLRAALAAEPALAELEECVAEARRNALPSERSLRADTAAVEAAVNEAMVWFDNPGSNLAVLWNMPLRDYAGELLTGSHHRLRKQAKQVDLADREAFHDLRIRVKKLRYPAELLKPLFDEARVEGYLARLVALQDVLGALNDAIVAFDLVVELPLSAAARGAVLGWIAREAEDCRSRFPEVRRQFRDASPFWTN